MCCGAALNARVARVVYGAADPKAGAARTLYRLLDDARLNHQVAVGGRRAKRGVRSAPERVLSKEKSVSGAEGWPSPVEGVRLEIG